MLSVNEKALEIAEEMMDWSEELKVKAIQYKNGSTVIDCGVNTMGSYDAGLMYIDICMGGFATCTIGIRKVKDIPLTFIDVITDHPAIACLGAQKAGWKINLDKFFAMASGPGRALALRPRKTYEAIRYEDDYDHAVIALEANKLPDEKVTQFIADECHVEASNLIALVAPTASLVGSVQLSGRTLETAVFKLNELGYDTTRIVSGTGTAPIAPVNKDDLSAIGSTNDSIIYYGSIVLTVGGFDEKIFNQLPSTVSKDYGRPFYITFKQADWDFTKIDPCIFAPGEVTVNDLETGKIYHAGHLNGEIILESYGIRRI